MKTVAVLFGGRSAEHEVSLQSAVNVVNSMDRSRYNPILIGIDKEGRWFLNEESIHLSDITNPRLIHLTEQSHSAALIPNGKEGRLISLNQTSGKSLFTETIDVLFPVLHGPYGEDGTIQGLAKLANLPCVGAGVLGSAVGMDKDIMKRLLRDAGIPISPFITIYSYNKDRISFKDLEPLFSRDSDFSGDIYIKPANMGSSVGISRVRREKDFKPALEEAFRYDVKIIAELGIRGRELECAILGNDHPKASGIGEIIPKDGFYSYDAKYVNEDGAVLQIPAALSIEETESLRECAVKTFTTLCCRGLGRVDMFLTEAGNVFVNEINTLPGFTNISMYPKLWEEAGIPQKELITQLIEFAVEDFHTMENLEVEA